MHALEIIIARNNPDTDLETLRHILTEAARPFHISNPTSTSKAKSVVSPEVIREGTVDGLAQIAPDTNTHRFRESDSRIS